MNMKKSALLPAAALATLGLAFSLSACSRNHDARTTAATDATTSATTSAETMATNASAAMQDKWEDLKNYSYDRRTEVAKQANDYAARIDTRIQSVSGEARDRLAEARDDLRSAASEVSNATAETWDATKERVGRAWQRAESAFQAAE